MNKKLKHIELFAGCGGLTLGMERAGFSLVFANEVSPMASITYAQNILNQDISQLNDKIKWVHTRHGHDNFSSRLREDLLSHNKLENSEVSFESDLSQMSKTLLIGDVRHLKSRLIEDHVLNPFKGNLDLISGGPPCQSFSLAGRREKNNYKNNLPLVFAEICEILSPKLVLLENVKGITSAFMDGTNKYYAWFEVAKTFASKGYVPVCMMLNSKFFKIPQNRPRYIMIAVRTDVFQVIYKKYPTHKVLNHLKSFMSKAESGISDVNIEDLNYYDAIKDSKYFDGIILPKLISEEQNSWVSVKDAIDDLSSSNDASSYVRNLNTLFCQNEANLKPGLAVFNHNSRNHSQKTKDRFFFYQLISRSPELKNQILKLKNNGLQIDLSISKKLFNLIKERSTGFKSANELNSFLNTVELTKKHSQRALLPDKPSPAQLTIPDDTCHYSITQNRVLTVREMARIQSFPDWFEFKSKETTGGKNRRYEVPQYTQVGNAVPPKLGYYLGLHLKALLKVE